MILSQQSGDLDILLEHNVEIFVAGSKKIIESLFSFSENTGVRYEQNMQMKKKQENSHRNFCQKI